MGEIIVSNEADLTTFIERLRMFLTRERSAEMEHSSLLLSNCSQKLLEQKGLALGNVSVTGVNVGLGGKS
jgi:DNA polymerase alpha-associated DNA helicase A